MRLARQGDKPVAAPTPAEQPTFQCPSCGVSFVVASWFSERIFCGRCTRVESARRTAMTGYRSSPESASDSKPGGTPPQGTTPPHHQQAP